MTSLTILAVRATPVTIPFEAPYCWHAGVQAGFTTTIVEVETNENVVGIGEAPTGSNARIINDLLAPRLVGAQALDLAECDRLCLPSPQTGANLLDTSVIRAYAGVEMALWDIRGKYFGQSLANLLGGRVRTTVPFSEYFAMRLRHNRRGGEQTPVEVARYCARMAEDFGSTVFEGKVATCSLDTEIEMVRELRAALGESAFLRLDANMGWSTTTARRALSAFERYGVESIEEPVATLEEMARLRPNTRLAFSSHDANLRVAARLGVPDAFVINIASRGGIRRTLAFVAACQEAGLEVRFYSPDAGVATAANLQLAAAVPWLSHSNQTLLRWQMDDVICEGPFSPRGGSLAVPAGNGLGVTLDHKALARGHARYLGEPAPSPSAPLHPSLERQNETRRGRRSRPSKNQSVRSEEDLP